jgi:Ca-activated chloride channel family protein
MRRYALPVALAAMLVVAGCSGGAGGDGGSGSVGLAAGGAQDANDFRNNVEAGYVPQPESLSATGLFHDYYFDTGQQRRCDRLFCPSYSRAVTADPLSGETERYLTVGLNSGLSAAEFEREKLNLVIVLDRSGSMSSGFEEYHYDGENGGGERVSKMTAAHRAVGTLTEHLTAADRFGVVSFGDTARTVVEMGRVGERDMHAVRDRVRSIQPGGSTNFEAGMRTAGAMLRPYRNPEDGRETRVIYVTDAMPNTGQVGGESLRGHLAGQADEGVYSTFVGVGVDFNSRFVGTVNAVEGANHYTVDSPRAFDRRMDEGFAYMVTPLVFDLSVAVESEAYEIDAVYGSPDADPGTGELLRVNTLFPSRTEAGRTEGGVVLVKLERTGGPTDAPVTLRASYETRSGERRSSVRTVRFQAREPPAYDSSGVRKAVLLSRYSDLLRNWMAYERAQAAGRDAEPPGERAGIRHRELGQWEQSSVDLRVSAVYRERIRAFLEYFRAEAAALGDADLDRERRVLEHLAGERGEPADGGKDREGGNAALAG